MPLNLTISPAETQLVARPGTTITQAYTITNNSPTSILLSTEVLPWNPVGTDGSVSYFKAKPNPHLEFSLNNSDLSLGQKFYLAPGQKKQLVLRIKSTSTTPLGDAYYTFFVSQDLSNSLNGDTSQSAATARIGSHILLSISNTESTSTDFSLSHFATQPNLKDIFLRQITFSAQIHNNSHHYNRPEGKLTISKNNRIIKEIDIFPSTVLANNSRDLTCLDQNQPVACTISPPFWPGAYTATVRVNSASATTVFFVLPYSLLLFLFLFTLIGYIFKKPRSNPPLDTTTGK